MVTSILGRPIGVALIVLEKSVSAIAVGLGAILAFVMRAKGADNPLALLFPKEFGETPQDIVVRWINHVLPHIGQTLMVWIAIGLVAWAIVLALEGYGLWFDRSWGELLLIVETCLFFPAEFIDIARHPSLTAFGSLVVNIAILVYVVRLYRRRGKERATSDRRLLRAGDS